MATPEDWGRCRNVPNPTREAGSLHHNDEPDTIARSCALRPWPVFGRGYYRRR